MNFRDFSLKPFTEGEIPGLTITGHAGRDGKIFSISYRLEGPLQDISLPLPASNPERKYCLWEETCLEFFIRPGGSSPYWEFNLSPAGHWNVFSFSSYREGMREEPAYNSLPLRIEKGPGLFSVSLEFLLDNLIGNEKKIKLAVSAVIRTKDGNLSYWALAHKKPKPDFHHQDSFVLEL